MALSNLQNDTKSQSSRKRSMMQQAIYDSFVKLNPAAQIRNIVMFIVYVGAIICTLVTATEFSSFNLQVTLWLWFTVLFANFAESLAEGRGKAQADSLRKSKKDTTARLLQGGKESVVPARSLKPVIR